MHKLLMTLLLFIAIDSFASSKPNFVGFSLGEINSKYENKIDMKYPGFKVSWTSIDQIRLKKGGVGEWLQTNRHLLRSDALMLGQNMAKKNSKGFFAIQNMRFEQLVVEREMVLTLDYEIVLW